MEEKEINKVLKTNHLMLIIALIFLIVTVGAFGYSFYVRYEEKQNPETFFDLIENNHDKEGAYTKITIDYIPYLFAEEDLTQGGTRKYYIIMDQEKYMYIARLTDETYNKLKDKADQETGSIEPTEFKGYVFKIPSKLKTLAANELTEVFKDSENPIKVTTSNLAEYVGDAYLDETEIPNNETENGAQAVGILAGLFALIFGGIAISQSFRTSKVTKNKELMEELKEELISMNDNPYKKLKIYLTNKYIISRYGGLEVFEYKNVIWAYALVRYQNGSAVGRTLMLCTKDKKRHSVAPTSANDPALDEIMTEIHDKNPEVRLGFTKENREYFKQYQKEIM